MLTNVKSRPSPNWDTRPAGISIDTVIIHYTGMKSTDEALERLCDPDAKVSAHYLIDEQGCVVQLVDEARRAWHAGVSCWRGTDNLNHSSIGIELVNPGHEFGYRPFPEVQIDSLKMLLEGITGRHPIHPHRFLGHSDIAPDRKTDPGELFPWAELAKSGFGIWSEVEGESTEKIVGPGDQGKLINSLNKQLGIVGYHLTDTERFGAATEYVIRAFQAHWRPETVSGILDVGTASRLADIAKQMRNTGERL